MEIANKDLPVEDFPNVELLSKTALTKHVAVDTQDTAPTDDETGPPQPGAPEPEKKPPAASEPPATAAKKPPDP
jgi:hypothetical protein